MNLRTADEMPGGPLVTRDNPQVFLHTALERFVRVWGSGSDLQLLDELEPRLGCVEVNALADLLTAIGDHVAARQLLYFHLVREAGRGEVNGLSDLQQSSQHATDPRVDWDEITRICTDIYSL